MGSAADTTIIAQIASMFDKAEGFSNRCAELALAAFKSVVLPGWMCLCDDVQGVGPATCLKARPLLCAARFGRLIIRVGGVAACAIGVVRAGRVCRIKVPSPKAKRRDMAITGGLDLRQMPLVPRIGARGSARQALPSGWR